MARVTIKDLDILAERINDVLLSYGSRSGVTVGNRNGYYTVDKVARDENGNISPYSGTIDNVNAGMNGPQCQEYLYGMLQALAMVADK